MIRLFSYLFLTLFFVVPSVGKAEVKNSEAVIVAEQANKNISKEQLRHESVVKLKNSIKQEKRNIAGGITNWTSTADQADEQPNGFTMLKGLAICIGLFFVGISVVQRLKNKTYAIRNSNKRIKILEKVSVGAKTALVLAEVDGRTILLSVGAEKVSFCPEKMPEKIEVVENSVQTTCKGKELADFAEIYAEERLSA